MEKRRSYSAAEDGNESEGFSPAAKEKVMCPACMASAALIGGSVVSTGGLTALVARILRPKKQLRIEESINFMERIERNGDHERTDDELNPEGK